MKRDLIVKQRASNLIFNHSAETWPENAAAAACIKIKAARLSSYSRMVCHGTLDRF
jgi:hypothetical protein